MLLVLTFGIAILLYKVGSGALAQAHCKRFLTLGMAKPAASVFMFGGMELTLML